MFTLSMIPPRQLCMGWLCSVPRKSAALAAALRLRTEDRLIRPILGP
jgi:hypothetical protein